MKTQGAAAHLAGQGQHLHTKPVLPDDVERLWNVPNQFHLNQPERVGLLIRQYFFPRGYNRAMIYFDWPFSYLFFWVILLISH